MSGLTLEGVERRYGRVRAVDGVDLHVPDGSFVCLLGPSGCGKTTLLRMIAGLERPDAGRVLLGGTDLVDVPTHRRELGMVFQSLALFPHLDVGDNIAYPLAIRGRPREERRARVTELLELVRLPGVERRAVSALSGGQRQRVAIARALALSPRLFLLDEPLSALDAKLREAMQIELREIQQRLGITTVVVTHDQREAMTMADLVVVMGEGRVRQCAPPVTVYREPADAFVADFVGQTNLLPATLAGSTLSVFGHAVPGVSVSSAAAEPARHGKTDPEAAGRAGIRGATQAATQATTGAATGADVGTATRDDRDATTRRTLSVRPEDLRLVAPPEGTLRGTVRFVRDLGASVETRIDVDGHELVAVTMSRERAHRVGDEVGLVLDAERAVVLALHDGPVGA